MTFRPSDHPRGQVTNAGQFREKPKASPDAEAALGLRQQASTDMRHDIRVAPAPLQFANGDVVRPQDTALGGFCSSWVPAEVTEGRMVERFPLRGLAQGFSPDSEDEEWQTDCEGGNCPDADESGFCRVECKVRSYRSAVQRGEEFPPIVIIVDREDGRVVWTNDDGNHRQATWLLEGYTHGPAMVFSTSGPDDPEVTHLLSVDDRTPMRHDV